MTTETLNVRRWAMCQNGCGMVEQTRLIPDDDDPPGRCPTCKGQTCECPSCLVEGIAALCAIVGPDAAPMHVAIGVLHDIAERQYIDGTEALPT